LGHQNEEKERDGHQCSTEYTSMVEATDASVNICLESHTLRQSKLNELIVGYASGMEVSCHGPPSC
jgi:hypothetical protein